MDVDDNESFVSNSDDLGFLNGQYDYSTDTENSVCDPTEKHVNFEYDDLDVTFEDSSIEESIKAAKALAASFYTECGNRTPKYSKLQSTLNPSNGALVLFDKKTSTPAVASTGSHGLKNLDLEIFAQIKLQSLKNKSGTGAYDTAKLSLLLNEDKTETKKEKESKPSQGLPRLKMSEQRKKIEERLETLGDYETPTHHKFKLMRENLRDVNDRMASHRILLDKYSTLDDEEKPKSVESVVEEKYKQVVDRIPSLEAPVTYRKSKEETDLYYNSPHTTNGYSKSLGGDDGPPMSELRGRIRRLLCRSKNNPHYYRM